MTMSHQRGVVEIIGLEQMDESDRPGIAATLDRLFLGFGLRDAELLEGVYTADADWVNAFGSMKNGGREIVDYLRGLFADQNFNDGTLIAGPQCTLRRLDRDNAVVRAHIQITGQSLVGGGVIAVRDNHSIRVISRQPDDSWAIVSEMFMDVREDQSYINHS